MFPYSNGHQHSYDASSLHVAIQRHLPTMTINLGEPSEALKDCGLEPHHIRRGCNLHTALVRSLRAVVRVKVQIEYIGSPRDPDVRPWYRCLFTMLAYRQAHPPHLPATRSGGSVLAPEAIQFEPHLITFHQIYSGDGDGKAWTEHDEPEPEWLDGFVYGVQHQAGMHLFTA